MLRSTSTSRAITNQVAAGALGTATLPWLLGAASARTSLALLPVLSMIIAGALLVLQRLRLQ